jgi:UDP-N-acetyl-D-mannosaminuronate dehydrogenase
MNINDLMTLTNQMGVSVKIVIEYANLCEPFKNELHYRGVLP